jgi:aspartate/methionine/tyrosine aminotransferase
MFSSRVPADLQANAFARALERARAAGRELLDLTMTNPTRVGIVYPDGLLRELASPAALTYTPQPFGLKAAREAVAREYHRRAVEVDPDRIVLTASTSEAYSLLFKLLCAPIDDEVLVPSPSYPLFDHLTRLDGVRAVAYQLEYAGRWMLDVATVDEAWSSRTRAVLAVSPNNPTGSILPAAELDELARRCAARGAALIVDEVFADYSLAAPEGSTRAASASNGGADTGDSDAALTFRLGGLSKSAGLPQVKLGWVAVSGPDVLVSRALERLELICDTYLSVSTPVQLAAPDLISAGAAVRAQLLDRIRFNYATLQAAAARYPSVEVLVAQAGWSAVLRVPARRTEEELVVALLERDGIIVHPGFFFDFPREAYLVVSLLPYPDSFRAGVSTLLERVDG